MSLPEFIFEVKTSPVATASTLEWLVARAKALGLTVDGLPKACITFTLSPSEGQTPKCASFQALRLQEEAHDLGIDLQDADHRKVMQ